MDNINSISFKTESSYSFLINIISENLECVLLARFLIPKYLLVILRKFAFSTFHNVYVK